MRVTLGAMMLLCQCGVGVAAAPAYAQAQPVPGRLARAIALDTPSPYATNAMLLQRLLSPRRRERERILLEAGGDELAPYPLDLGAEHFALYVPRQRPAAGYGLLVFIPPWQDAHLPMGWDHGLDRAGIIFVSAAQSGNDESIPARRIPLALTAAYALARKYQIDPDRIFVGGFSGGSRVALRVALAYPDIFAGVLLDAGSDPVGTDDIPLPGRALMDILQTRTRFVFVTGAMDAVNLAKDMETRLSLSSWCIEPTRSFEVPNVGHDVTDAAGLSAALDALTGPHRSDPARSARCRAALDARLAQARADAAALHALPPTAATDAALDRLDRTYGALLEPAPPVISPH